MSFFSKLMFWKEPELDMGPKGFEDLSKDFGIGGGKETGFGLTKDPLGADRTPGLGGTGELPSQGLGADISMKGPGFEHAEEPAPFRSQPERKPVYYQEVPQQGFGGGYNQQQYQRDFAKDMEIISAKLDSIKAMLDTINHRIDTIERQQSKKGRMEW